MQQLVRKFEAEITFDFGTVIGTMENPQPSPLSLMQEMVADGHSFAAAASRISQSRPLRPFAASSDGAQPTRTLFALGWTRDAHAAPLHVLQDQVHLRGAQGVVEGVVLREQRQLEIG